MVREPTDSEIAVAVLYRLGQQEVYEKTLFAASTTLSILLREGTVIQPDSSSILFVPAHTLGAYGQRLYYGLTDEQREQVDQVVTELRRTRTA